MQTIPEYIPTKTACPSAQQVWQFAREVGYPAAIWRLPNSTEKHLIIHTDTTLAELPIDLEELPAGFVLSRFANFDEGNGEPFQALFLRADVHLVSHHNADWEPASETQSDLLTQIQDQTKAEQVNPPTPPIRLTILTDSADERQRFEQNVSAAIEKMRQNAFRKVVLSRTKKMVFDQVPDVIHLFDQLCRAYPTAFISAVWLPELQQVWMSATPERLVSVDAKGFFRTLSLAGTQSAYHADGQLKRPADALWSQKEIEEQALVSRYIIECFKKIRLREYLEEGPKTILAGNLMHLGSHFTVDTQAVRYPQLGTVMLRLLHPTSAVCGMPRQSAFAFIQQHEGYNREFFSGFLGPVNIQSESHLFVHIRCLKLEGQTATLYAGAGITEDSNPEREWQETEMKCQTLLRAWS